MTLLGRVGRDAEMRGSSVHPVVFSLATSHVFRKTDGRMIVLLHCHSYLISVYISIKYYDWLEKSLW